MGNKPKKSHLAQVRDELASILGRTPDTGEVLRYAFQKAKEQAREKLNAPAED